MSGERKHIIGLTGGIASGKSAVAACWRALGAAVLDADAVSRSALKTDGACYAAVLERFGTDYQTADGSLDRRRLGTLVFSNATARAALNAIVHPYVIDTLQKATLQCADDPIVWEVPLLIESGMNEYCGQVVLVTAPQDTRIQRIMARDELSEAGARARVSAQLSDTEKARYADYILENNDTIQALIKKAQALWTQLSERRGNGSKG